MPIENDVFYCDPKSSFHASYQGLKEDVIQLLAGNLPAQHSHEYTLILQLIVAILNDQTFVLESGCTVDEDQQATQSFGELCSSNSNLQEKIATAFREPNDFSWLMGSKASIGIRTSGTTGTAKLVFHDTRSLTRHVAIDESHTNDVWAMSYPIQSFAGVQVFLQAFCNRNPIIQLKSLSTGEAESTINKYQITHLAGTPSYIRLLTASETSLPSIRAVTVGGEVMSDRLSAAINSSFPNAKVRNVYASSEFGALLSSYGSVFTVPERLKDLVRVVDGELQVHSSLVAHSIRSRMETDFYSTGDCVDVLQDSPLVLRFASRRKDWINVGGNKVNPIEVEECIIEMQEIKNASVYGRSSSVLGQIVCARIEVNEGSTITPAQIHSFVKDRLPSFAIPRHFEFVDSIPTNSTGKKLRTL